MYGNKTNYQGNWVYRPDYYNDGCSFGTIYKDEKAFNENNGEVCYIPEAVWSDAESVLIGGKEYFFVEGYTRHDLEMLLEGETDETGAPIDIEYFFQNLTWACPETYLNEINY